MGFFSKVEQGVSKGISNFNAPNYIYWSIIPWFVTFLFASLITILAVWNVKTTKVCDKQDKNCSDVKFHLWQKILLVLFIATFTASIVAAIVYRTALYVYNPKMAAGIAVAGYAQDALFD